MRQNDLINRGTSTKYIRGNIIEFENEICVIWKYIF